MTQALEQLLITLLTVYHTALCQHILQISGCTALKPNCSLFASLRTVFQQPCQILDMNILLGQIDEITIFQTVIFLFECDRPEQFFQFFLGDLGISQIHLQHVDIGIQTHGCSQIAHLADMQPLVFLGIKDLKPILQCLDTLCQEFIDRILMLHDEMIILYLKVMAVDIQDKLLLLLTIPDQDHRFREGILLQRIHLILSIDKDQSGQQMIPVLFMFHIQIQSGMKRLDHIIVPKFARHLHVHGFLDHRQHLFHKVLFVLCPELHRLLPRGKNARIKWQQFVDILLIRQIQIPVIIQDISAVRQRRQAVIFPILQNDRILSHLQFKVQFGVAVNDRNRMKLSLGERQFTVQSPSQFQQTAQHIFGQHQFLAVKQVGIVGLSQSLLDLIDLTQILHNPL